MLKLSVFYQYTEGTKFNMEYFLTKHMPLVEKAWGGALKKKEIDSGLCGSERDTPPIYIASIHLYFDSIESMLSAVNQQHQEMEKDRPHFTDILPITQLSRVESC